MNRKIDILDDLTINKIAAGEVVEGPYSVVKELIENSIDADASIITLEIKDGGKQYIRITDNGIGIKEEYVEKAFLRHSTSKIHSIDDLDSIISLGFRGEALASIAAVSQVEIITRTSEQQHGVLIEIIGGKVQCKKHVGCPIGTTIIVRNLFFNTPARLKFMKSTQSETIKISEIITRLSLSNPKISFKYINNNNIMFTTPGKGMLSDVILSVFNKDTFKNLISLNVEKLSMSLDGYIGQPTFVRGNRNLQIIFVNGRYIKSRLISKAIEDAYKEKIVINKHPICILNLSIDPSVIDVNVHPAKTEIKFQAEDEIYEFVFNSIVNTLKQSITISELSILGPKSSQPDNKTNHILDLEVEKPVVNRHSIINDKEILINENKEEYVDSFAYKTIDQFIDKKLYKENETEIKANKENQNVIQESFLNTLLKEYKIIGQIFNTYIILEKEEAIYLIDQHAAHERLTYNKFLNEIKNESVISQRLLEPKVLELSNEDYLLLFKNISIFTKLGFIIEDFGANTIIIREVPMALGKPQNFSFIYEVLDEVKNNNNIDNYFEDTIIKKACKESIKANDKLDYYEIKRLIEDILKLTPPLTCPHGRPIVLTINKYNIEKYFKRIQ